MSIVPLKKITFCGEVEDAEFITNALQESGFLHVITQNEDSDIGENYSVKTTNENIKAFNYIMHCKDKLHMVMEDPDFDGEVILDEIIELQETSEELVAKREKIEKEIENLSVWGRFEPINPEEFDNHKMWLYIIPNNRMRHIPKDIIYHIVRVKEDGYYIVVLSENKPENMPTKELNFKNLSMSSLEAELEEVNEQLDDIETRRLEMTKYRYLLAHSINDLNNEAIRVEAEYKSLHDENFFILKAYIGENAIEDAKELAFALGVSVFIENISDKDNAPTLLKNPEAISGGEELVKFYSVPGYKNLDPSNVVFFSFALFFAMIMSDFGYACVLGIILLIFNGKMNKSQMGKRIRAMSWFIVGTSMIWGALVGSYFGTMPGQESKLYALTSSFKKLDMDNINLMMTISIYTGIFHICLANFLVAWKYKNTFFSLSKIGWCAISLSGLVFIPQLMMGTEFSAGEISLAKYGLIGGIILVFLFTSKSKNIIKRIIDGLLGLTSLSGAFGDILSYLRLFALGLASASLAITFNQLAVGMVESIHIFGYLLGAIILIIGHGINFALGILGGLVHGLRLNVLEFFNWSISDEGYPFHTFSKTEVKKWIKL